MGAFSRGNAGSTFLLLLWYICVCSVNARRSLVAQNTTRSAFDLPDMHDAGEIKGLSTLGNSIARRVKFWN